MSVSEWSCSFWRAMHQNTCIYICECVTCVCHQINSLFHIVSIHNQGIFEKVVRILMQPDMQSLFKHISMCCELHRCATCNTNLSLSILFFPSSLSPLHSSSIPMLSNWTCSTGRTHTQQTVLWVHQNGTLITFSPSPRPLIQIPFSNSSIRIDFFVRYWVQLLATTQ